MTFKSYNMEQSAFTPTPTPLHIYIHYFTHKEYQKSLESRTGVLNALCNSNQVSQKTGTSLVIAQELIDKEVQKSLEMCYLDKN